MMSENQHSQLSVKYESESENICKEITVLEVTKLLKPLSPKHNEVTS